MTYLAAWLLAVGAADLLRAGGALAPARRPLVPVVATATLALVWFGIGAPHDVWALAWPLLGALAAGWGLLSARAVDLGRTTPLTVSGEQRTVRGGGLRAASLCLLAGGCLVSLALNGHAPVPAGPVADWYAGLRLASLRGTDLAHSLLVLGVLVCQIGTANVVVRLALDSAGARSEPGVLRGGRLVGPLERLFVVGLGLAGQPTAASIVVAAKGLLRFPELNKQPAAGQRIDAVTEYFVVGSLVSWLVALLGICLARA